MLIREGEMSSIESVHSISKTSQAEKGKGSKDFESDESEFRGDAYVSKAEVNSLRAFEISKMVLNFEFKPRRLSPNTEEFFFEKFKVNLLLAERFSILQPEHIARYYNAGREGEIGQSYRIVVEKGEKEYSLKYEGNSGLAEIDILLKLGRNSVFAWMVSLAHIIMALERLGVYNSDLTFRNTLKLGEAFLCIDFDKAYQFRAVGPEESRNESEAKPALIATGKMIAIWLQSEAAAERAMNEVLRDMLKGES